MPIPYPRMGEEQIYTGTPWSADMLNDTRPTRGQVSPAYEEERRMQHGRYLAGLGGGEAVPRAMGEPDWSDQDLRDLENEDDAVGSGIFDPAGTSTVHQTMGVFQDHPSVPGYIARNPPFTINSEVADITDGADVVEVPGGGMFYVERGGHLVGPPPGPRPPPIPPLLARHRTGTDQPYVFLGKQAPAPSGAQPSYPAPQRVPFAPMQQRVPPNVSIVNPAVSRVAVGAVDTSPSWGSYIFAGVMVGAAAALLVSTVGGKKGR